MEAITSEGESALQHMECHIKSCDKVGKREGLALAFSDRYQITHVDCIDAMRCEAEQKNKIRSYSMEMSFANCSRSKVQSIHTNKFGSILALESTDMTANILV